MRWHVWLVLGVLAIGLMFTISMTSSTPSVPSMLVIPDEDDIEALGRMIASENPKDLLIVQRAIAWAARNEAARERKSVADLVMPGGVPGHQKGRYATTINPATTATRLIAFDVLSGKVPDPTGGAIQFDAPHTQDLLFARGDAHHDAAGIYDIRTSEGKVPVYLPGVDPNHMRWWRYA